MKPDQNSATALTGGGSTLRISGLTATDGYVLTVQADGTLATEAPGASGVGGSTGATDNALLRADGTGGATVQSSGITVADADSGVAEMSSARLVSGVRTISSSPDTQLVSDDVLLFSSAITVNLLTSCTTGRHFVYLCTASATLTLDPGGTDTINGGSAGTALAIPCAAGQRVDLVRSASGAWRAVLPPVSVAVRAYVSGGVLYAQGVTLDASGTPLAASAPVAMSAEGTDYSESWAGTDITLTGPLVGNTGAIQSNSRRYVVALSDLGIVLTAANRRWAQVHVQADSITDNSEARAGTVDLGCYLGVGSTTAQLGISLYRPSTGTSYGIDLFQASATSFTVVDSATTLRGGLSWYSWPTNTGTVASRSVNSSGEYLGGANSAGTAINASPPTHFVVFIRSAASASGAAFSNPRFLAYFGPQMAAL